jgi:hypothetical protein
VTLNAAQMLLELYIRDLQREVATLRRELAQAHRLIAQRMRPTMPLTASAIEELSATEDR